ncbi:hypothetical protein VNO77_00221 [Canavalia gladiata]|uniref:Uncharacterized protein n=1 Tax=Canavalia gladiata TaxID=3824 RepID=A0AAN9R537_CANGL
MYILRQRTNFVSVDKFSYFLVAGLIFYALARVGLGCIFLHIQKQTKRSLLLTRRTMHGNRGLDPLNRLDSERGENEQSQSSSTKCCTEHGSLE